MNDFMYNDRRTYTEEEEKLRSENVHMAGHKRFCFKYYGTDDMKKYSFRGEKYKEEYIDNIFHFESDSIQDMYKKLSDFIYGLEENFPIVLFDNCESDKFFGKSHFRNNRGSIEIEDNINNTKVVLSWDDIIKQYHLLRAFGVIGEGEEDEKEK